VQEVLRFAVLGIGVGAIYAIAAQGVVLIYRGSGVLNFAHGAIALLAASTFGALRDGGTGALPAGIASVGLATLIGVLIHLLVMRPLRASSPLARVVATLGLLGIVQSASTLRYGTDVRLVPSFLPTDPVELTNEITVSTDRILLLVIAIVLALGLWGLYRYTNFGKSTSAVAENRRAAAALGVSPDVIATMNWAIGAGLAGLAGVLIVPITGLPGNLALLIIPALAAALVGGFSSFPLTLVGGVALGIAESLLNNYVTQQGWARSAPFLVIVIVLIVRGTSLPVRGFVQERLPAVGRTTLPPWARWALIAIGAVAVFVAPADLAIAATTTLLAAIVCLSVVVITGLAGQLSLAQYGLAGVGAFVSARLAAVFGVPFPLALLAGMVVAAPVGMLFALPALRTRGLYLAIATLGLSLGVEQIVLFNRDWTGGFTGTVVDDPTLLGWEIGSINHPNRYALVVFVAFSLLALAVVNIRSGAVGRRLLATRANERAAASLGISVTAAKLYAFALGSVIAATAGGLLAFRLPNVQFGEYGVFLSMHAVVLTVLGGVGFISGALIGGALTVSGLGSQLIDAFIHLDDWFTLVTSTVLVVNLVRDPDGLARRAADLVAFARRKLQVRPPTPTAGSPAVATSAWGRCEPATLQVDGVSIRFGGMQALDAVSLTVGAGEVVGLIGPNGAGKTTFIDAVTGYNTPSSGRVRLGETDLTRRSPAYRARAGVGRTFQGLELFDDLTVRENLQAASDGHGHALWISELVRPQRTLELPDQAARAVDILELGDSLDLFPSDLSYGRRRLLAIARAVASSPSVLLLDEPAAGLDEAESREVTTLIRRLAEECGLAILLVEHDMEVVMSSCDRVSVLDFGRLIAEGTPQEIQANPRVRTAYLGDDLLDERPPRTDEQAIAVAGGDLA
jgi:sulfate-transporting ATPase